jgi:hypothetical protein
MSAIVPKALRGHSASLAQAGWLCLAAAAEVVGGEHGGDVCGGLGRHRLPEDLGFAGMLLQVRPRPFGSTSSTAGDPVRTECSSTLKVAARTGRPIIRVKARIDIG